MTRSLAIFCGGLGQWVFAQDVALPVRGSIPRPVLQIVTPQKLNAFRASLPATVNDRWQDFFHDPATLCYSDAEIPPAYQHADAGLVVNGARMGFGPGNRTTTFHWTNYNISGDFLERQKPHGQGGNGNIEFPWRTPGGLDFVEDSTASFKMMRLPARQGSGDGSHWPVSFYQGTLPGSRMGPHQGYSWLFPVGTVFGEVLALRDSQGLLHTFEVRIRVRELTYWDVDILRPFPTHKDLVKRLTELDSVRYAGLIDQITKPVVLTQKTLSDPDHRTRRGFVAQAAEDVLPLIGEELAAALLDSTPFKSAVGATWREGSTAAAFAPSSTEPFSIVPRGYLGTALGTDTVSCAKCHESTLRHVDEFDTPRQWYGRIRGSDRIFSFHPIDPASISPNGSPRPVRLRREFVDAGIVEWYDPTKHPSEVYQVISD